MLDIENRGVDTTQTYQIITISHHSWCKIAISSSQFQSPAIQLETGDIGGGWKTFCSDLEKLNNKNACDFPMRTLAITDLLFVTDLALLIVAKTSARSVLFL
jgi:hypothetical protein